MQHPDRSGVLLVDGQGRSDLVQLGDVAHQASQLRLVFGEVVDHVLHAAHHLGGAGEQTGVAGLRNRPRIESEIRHTASGGEHHQGGERAHQGPHPTTEQQQAHQAAVPTEASTARHANMTAPCFTSATMLAPSRWIDSGFCTISSAAVNRISAIVASNRSGAACVSNASLPNGAILITVSPRHDGPTAKTTSAADRSQHLTAHCQPGPSPGDPCGSTFSS